MRRLNVFFGFVAVLLTMPGAVFAAPNAALKALYIERQDLQILFDAKTYLVRPYVFTAATSLEDWARQYGWRENTTLRAYKPAGRIPKPIKGADDPKPETQAASYVVMDRASGLIIAEHNAGVPRPIASLTKLMTASVVLSYKVSPKKIQTITQDDMVGGSALGVKAGTRLVVDDLFYAAMLPSANDATNALAAATGLTRKAFVDVMNAKAEALGLTRTVFADPTGIDEGNVSTPREFAFLADSIFKLREVRRYTTTAKRTLQLLPSRKTVTVKNSDHLLTQPQYDHIYVTAGKTGYLGPELGWSIAVSMKKTTGKSPELLLVLLGEPKLAQSMADAEALAQWAWGHYAWK